MDLNDTEGNGNEWCVFCSIAKGQDDEADVLKKHIESCFSLNNGHIDLVERMAEMARAVLLDSGVTDMKDIRLGFHQPPYISVRHLHLHVLAPASRISADMLYKFIPGTPSFVSVLHEREFLTPCPPQIQDSHGKKCILLFATNQWNAPPTHLKIQTSLQNFKTAIKTMAQYNLYLI
ncbi:adenosine 5'-monophosphoramidase HINT3-like isoform X2 [Nerophis ophidion]|uniref:adenosine 5'-monophosphoramidase HINT3-like isoform X2 n=1 Tax=Nerophis ophidion TaxID=159077 RepID=UPI002ADFF996|nr:adenosine 5'-monophosphoramidase HINT3-like isoform X2 [Nerophis ophidion]